LPFIINLILYIFNLIVNFDKIQKIHFRDRGREFLHYSIIVVAQIHHASCPRRKRRNCP